MRHFLSAVFILLLFASCKDTGKLRAPVKEKGLYGYIDESGDYVVAPKFTEAWSYINGSALVCEKNQWSLIDKNGKYILQNAFDTVIPFSADCFVGRKNGQYGFYAHGTGKTLIAPAYQQVYAFTDNLCVVQQGFNLGIVNSKGELTCKPILQDLKQPLGPLSIVIQLDTTDQLAMLMAMTEDGSGGKKGLINKKGVLVLHPDYDDIFDDSQHGWYYPFHKVQDTDAEGHDLPAAIGKYGICDTTGKIIVAPQYDEMPAWGDGLFRIRLGKMYGFANAQGQIVIQPQFDYVSPFSEGKAIASLNNKVSIIDKQGKTLVDQMSGISGTFSFKNGLARFQDMDRYFGFINEKGEQVIRSIFDAADDFEHGRAIVQENNKYGVIDITGKYIIPPNYDFIFDLEDGYYQLKNEDGTTGVVDSTGKIILPLVFTEIFRIQKTFFNVEKDGKNGCYDLSGKEIYPPVSTIGVYFTNNRAEVEEGGKYGLIDPKGKLLLPVAYDSIGFFFKGFATILQKGQYGAIDSTGKIIVKPQFAELRPIVNGYAVFQQQGKFGYIDSEGEIVIKARFEEAAVLVDPDRKNLN